MASELCHMFEKSHSENKEENRCFTMKRKKQFPPLVLSSDSEEDDPSISENNKKRNNIIINIKNNSIEYL